MITVFGHLGTPDEALRLATQRADVVVGGRRHLDDLGVPDAKRIVLGALTPAVEQMQALPEETDVVIIASGDPLWFGVVRKLRAAGLHPRVVTAASSVAEAFARVGLPWDDAITVSAHGRPVDAAIQAARRYAKVAVMTDPRTPLAVLSEPLADLGRTFVLAERLGEADERVRVMTGDELAACDDVGSPNIVLILERHPGADWPNDGVTSTLPRPAEPPMASRERLDRAPLSALRIGQVYSSAAGRSNADRIDAALRQTTVRFDGPASRGLVDAFAECDLVISHLALGATTRLIAPLLQSKKQDPGVVVVDQGGHFAVPLVGGHVGGANALADRIAEALGGTPVLTTATDSLGIPALDTLGWVVLGDVAGVTAAMLDGQAVLVRRERRWPLPPLPANVAENVADPVAEIVITQRSADQLDAPKLPRVVLHPKSLVVGMGCNSGTSEATLRALLEESLASAGLSIHSVSALTSIDVKAHEGGLVRLAKHLAVPYITYAADELAQHQVPNPSTVVEGEVGTASVSEASVLERGAKLVVNKRKCPEATCAIGELPARGELRIVGLGPGHRDLLTPMAREAIETATVVVGYIPYVRQIKDLISPHAEMAATKMGTEEQRTAFAIERARQGHAVAFVSSGDPSIYAMASPTLERGTEGIDVRVIPGVTAELAASALCGAPLGHDHVTISLSDLHTSWADIERRLHAAAEGDFVVTLYNPRSRKRTTHLPRALEILGAKRPKDTPVMAVYEAFRPKQHLRWGTFETFRPEWVDMHTIVIVGSSSTKFVATGDGDQAIVTPRDYQWMGTIQGGNC